jgi:GTP-binding protein
VDGVVSDVAATAVARVGKTPGATASVNMYALHDAARGGGDAFRDVLGLCDLPGFGYAKLSKQVQESVQLAAERYLSRRKHLALGVLLVDIRRTPSDDDRAVLAALYDLGIPLLVVATKLDKVTSKSAKRASRRYVPGLGCRLTSP